MGGMKIHTGKYTLWAKHAIYMAEKMYGFMYVWAEISVNVKKAMVQKRTTEPS